MSVLLPLQPKDFVIDNRPKKVGVNPDDPSVERYNGPIGEVVEVSESGFKVSWPADGKVGPYVMGYNWTFMELGIKKFTP